jgi:L-methionine (R)-S-oxide reductase
MESTRKNGRYERIFEQLSELLTKTTDPDARMATVTALLHHKIDYFSWTGFYMLRKGRLTVRTYQGPLACQILKKHTGVCWAAIDGRHTILVPDVSKFPGHIACSSSSRSEIAIPLRNKQGKITGVLDVDSDSPGSFDDTDAAWLEKIVNLIC